MATRSWNRVELIGNLTRDPELRYTPSGNAVVTFSVATNRTFMSEGEKKEEADFHRCVAWNKLAELCSQLLKKGNKVFISGRLQNRSWEGSDGQTRNTTEIVIEDMILLTSKNTTSEFSANEDVTPAYSQKSIYVPKSKSETPPEEKEAPVVKETEEQQPDDTPPVEESKPEKTAKNQKEEVEDLDDLPF